MMDDLSELIVNLPPEQLVTTREQMLESMRNGREQYEEVVRGLGMAEDEVEEYLAYLRRIEQIAMDIWR